MRKKFRNTGCAALAAALGLISAVAPAQDPLPKGEQSGIYVGELKVQPAVVESAQKNGKLLSIKLAAQSLDTQFISALSAARVFQVMERKRKADVEQEQGFAATAVDVNDKDAAQAGKMAGAKYAFLPQIDGFEDLVDTQEYKAIGRTSMRRRLFLSATVTIVDTTTGRLLPDVANVQMTQEEIVENSRTGTGLQGSDIAVVELAKKVANSLCQDAIALLRPAKVLAVTGPQVLINRGAPAGFKEGMAVEFFAFEEVKDEDSGETFRNEVFVGKGSIIRADPKQSYARIEGNNLGVAKGCVVKPVKVKAVKLEVPVSAPGGSFPEDPRRVPAKPADSAPGSSDKPLQFDTDATVPSANAAPKTTKQ
jgi:curli biogenesis system outer membrane secretion channel CsgG